MQTTIQPVHDRVRENTPRTINEQIDQKTQQNINKYAHKNEIAIRSRMNELSKEWDIERSLELTASLLALSGIILGVTRNKRWLIMPVVITAFLAQHALQGWCPPLPLFRKLGVRTQKEIEKEKEALREFLKKDKFV